MGKIELKDLIKQLDVEYEKESWIAQLVERNEQGEYEWKYEIPRDEQDPRYVKSFNIDEEEQYKSFFTKYGFVVINNILSEEECKASIADIWTVLETSPFYSSLHINRYDPTSFSRWPGGMPQVEGIVGERPVITQTALFNRQNPLFYRAYAHLLNSPHLLVNHDR